MEIQYINSVIKVTSFDTPVARLSLCFLVWQMVTRLYRFVSVFNILNPIQKPNDIFSAGAKAKYVPERTSPGVYV